MKIWSGGWSTACLVCASLTLPTAAHADIGNVAAVNRNMEGTPPKAVRRDLNIGDGVVTEERIETSNVGSGQLLFVDQTSLSVAPNSNLVLDKYVFDPNQNTGDMALSMVKGTIRFIGGKITKERTAFVRTPTATIGIRGGMVHIEVDEDGNTKVIHIAGAFTEVSYNGDADGDGLDDGPPSGGDSDGDLSLTAPQPSAPGSSAPSPAAQPTSGQSPDGNARPISSIILSRPSATAIATPGLVEFSGVATTEQVAAAYNLLTVPGDGGVTQIVGPEEVNPKVARLAPNLSGRLGGFTEQPVSTEGERPQPVLEDPNIDTPELRAEIAEVDATVPENLIPIEAPPPEQAPEALPPPPPTSLPLVAPESAALVASFTSADANGDGFVRFGDTGVGSLTGSGGGRSVTLPVPLDSSELLVSHPVAEFLTPEAVAINPFTGLFEFDGANSDSPLGPLEGVGFSDFLEEFHFVPFRAPDSIFGPLTGAALFGTPTPGQGQFFLADPNLPNANTADVYLHEFGMDTGRGFLAAGPASLVPGTLTVIGNSGGDRFQAGTSTANPAADGRVLAGTLLFDNTGAGAREENFSLMVAPLSSRGGEFRITGNGVATFNSRAQDQYGFFSAPYGTLEDANGNTLFGTTGNYFALSSVTFDDNGSPQFPAAFGTESTLNDAGPNGTAEVNTSFSAVQFTRDAAQARVIEEPLAFASSTSGTPGFNQGFASGLAVCSSGNCGTSNGPDENSGFYVLRSQSGGVNIAFDVDPTGAGQDLNGISGQLSLQDDGLSGILGRSTGPTPFTFDFSAQNSADETTIYADDLRFAVQSDRANQIIAGATAPASFMLASKDALETSGIGLLFTGSQDVQPDFLRWGWWAASYEVEDAATGEVRTDLVPLGQFIAGHSPTEGDIPTGIVATYSGFAVGTQADLTGGGTATVGGSFDLTYDFGANRGNFSLTLNDVAGTPDFNITTAVSAGTLRSEYAGGSASSIGSLDVQGAFVTGAGNPIAATAGTFDVQRPLDNSQTVGVFGSTSLTTQ